MNFNLYLDDQTAKELDRTAKKLGETRSGLIRKALREWLDKKTLGSPGWPLLISGVARRSRHAAVRIVSRRIAATA